MHPGRKASHMKREITLRQYRTVDLVMTLVIMLVSQAVIYFAATKWYLDQLYIVSPVAAITAIVFMRWGAYAAIHAFAGGAAHCLLFGGGWTQLLIFSLGNLLSLFALFLIKKQGKENREAHGQRKTPVWQRKLAIFKKRCP